MTLVEKQNLLDDVPKSIPEEIFQTLLSTPNLKIERIISRGHQSEQHFWYDQDQHEWVLVVKGEARLQFEDGVVHLKPGDYIHIPAHQKHRVDWTIPEEETIWLAIFY